MTVFVGNQGTGKSTVAKLISMFTWMEKALVRGDFDPKWLERKNRLRNQYLNFNRLESYLKENGHGKTQLEFEGDVFTFRYVEGSLQVVPSLEHAYSLPQIMYVPAERNFIAYFPPLNGSCSTAFWS